MRQIDLQEYQQSEAIPLSITERDDLQAVLPSLTIVPAAGEDAAYHLTPSSTVGAVEIGDLSVLIRPKIGIPTAALAGVLRHGRVQVPRGAAV